MKTFMRYYCLIIIFIFATVYYLSQKNEPSELVKAKKILKNGKIFSKNEVPTSSFQSNKINKKYILHKIKASQNHTGNKKGEYKQRFPVAIIGGAKKCGTTALAHFLSEHPDVCECAVGEVKFFSDLKSYEKGYDYYLSLMPKSYENQITIEKTAGTLVTYNAIERIYNFSPKMKLIFTFRNPVQRLISDMAHMMEHETGTREYLERKMYLNKSKKINKGFSIVRVGTYAEHIKKYLEFFPIEQLHIINGEEFVTNPAKVMVELQKFLGIREVINEEFFVFDKKKGFYCFKGRRDVECLSKGTGRKNKPVLSNDMIERLTEFYKPFNREFIKVTGKDFGWPT